MIGGKGRLPDRGARNFEPDQDVGKLAADRLMLYQPPAALHAQLRVVERGLVGGAADAEVERLCQRNAAAGIGNARADEVFGSHAAISERHLAAGAVAPALA